MSDYRTMREIPARIALERIMPEEGSGRWVTVLGGGMAGLFCAAFLAKRGWRVRVLEAASRVGGGLAEFTRYGQSFETGMHYVGGVSASLTHGGLLSQALHLLGITDQVKFEPMPPQCFEHVVMGGESYEFPVGLGNFVNYLAARFPAERAGLEAWAQDLYNLYPLDGIDQLFPEGFKAPNPGLTVEAFIARRIKDGRLRKLLLWDWPLYYGPVSTTPAYVYAVITRSIIDGPCRLSEGPSRLAAALANLILKEGGEVICGQKAKAIAVEGGSAVGVWCAKAGGEKEDPGLFWEADRIVSALPIKFTLGMLPEGVVSKAWRHRVASRVETASTFSLFAVLRPGAMPYCGTHQVYYKSWDDVARCEDPASEAWPSALMWLTPPCGKDALGFARTLKVMVPMDYALWSPWERTRTGHRGGEYEAFKQSCTEALLTRLREIIPNWDDIVDRCFAATPLTQRDYTGSPRGENYGFVKEAATYPADVFFPLTKIRGLYLCGQHLHLHGLIGVPLTAILTASALR